ncbi:class I SAM-dependent methyltransferase [Sphingomonas sabuli]|uniref:Class I SAM-dependent methyltransferase n=1 Tax=Sphingomonas sabuli TaxID=2764186 RepID=A0A7G9KZJ3_9SPHN|nr:class I SAM-dependent methyltransferase [Sphingomonas sabuli]
MSGIGQMIDKLLTHGSITVIQPGKAPETHGPGDGPAVTIRLTDNKLPLQVLKNPRLAFGEAYMDGRLVLENGTILELLQMIMGSNPWEEGRPARAMLNRGKGRALLRLFQRNDTKTSRKNVAHHYDLGDDLYDLFLDADRQYSCAYFTSPDKELEDAQADKKAHIASKLYLKPGLRVLDIGCGWGGMAIYLNQVADVEVLGITLSEDQLRVARQRAADAGVADRVKFELVDYRVLEGEFDRIVSVGMFEHVGLEFYDEFFASCRRLLKRDGVMLLHTIGKFGISKKADPFTDKWIFPGYHVPSLSQMFTASEKSKMMVADLETLRLHYAYTLRHWLDRVHENRAKIVEMYDERFFRMWEFYLAGGIVMFESGAGCNYQVQFIRDRRALPITRDYMIEAEQALRAKAAAGKEKGPARGRRASSSVKQPA